MKNDVTILTLDAGTSGLKCSLFAPDGALICARVAEYAVNYPREGWAEQSAEDFISAAVTAIRSVGEQTSLKSVCAIGLSGTMNGCIPIDGRGEALHPNIIHLDTRAQKQVARISDAMGAQAFYAITGNRPDVHYGLPKMMWLRENMPDIYAKARWFVNTKDVIYAYLTGINGRSDFSDAALFGALNCNTLKWDDDVVSAAGVDKSKLPELFPSSDVSGRLTRSAAIATGLTEGVCVSIGAGDGPCATHGSGVYDENGAYLTIGSSAWVDALSLKPVIDPQMRAFNYADMNPEYTNVCGTVQCAATAFDYMMTAVLGITLPDGSIDFTRAENMALSSPAGANGLFFMPTLMGERCPWWDANARGMLVGLTLTHTKQDMVRAVYEGVAQALNNCGWVLRENGVPVKELILSGGGVNSLVWRQMFSDVFNVKTRTHANPREATSLGAAMAAGVGVKVYESYEDAARTVKTIDERTPNADDADAYKRHTDVYRALYGQMQSAMHAISAYQAAETRTK